MPLKQNKHIQSLKYPVIKIFKNKQQANFTAKDADSLLKAVYTELKGADFFKFLTKKDLTNPTLIGFYIQIQPGIKINKNVFCDSKTLLYKAVQDDYLKSWRKTGNVVKTGRLFIPIEEFCNFNQISFKKFIIKHKKNAETVLVHDINNSFKNIEKNYYKSITEINSNSNSQSNIQKREQKRETKHLVCELTVDLVKIYKMKTQNKTTISKINNNIKSL